MFRLRNIRLAFLKSGDYIAKMDKTVVELLLEAEAAFVAKVEYLQAQLDPVQRELATVRRALKAARGPQPSSDQLQLLPSSGSEATEASRNHFMAYPDDVLTKQYRHLTMKQLVRRALQEHFTEGATAKQMLELFRHEWGRDDVVRTSLSPQLTRLKREGVIALHGLVWHLLRPDRRVFHQAPRAIELEPPPIETEGGS
jgi:hypothetical protein